MTQREGWGFAQKNYRRRDQRSPNDLRLRYKSISHLKETDGRDDSAAYGFRGDFDENKGLWELEIGDDMQDRERGLEIFNVDTSDREEDQMKFEMLKKI